jgi:hypothetical protein
MLENTQTYVDKLADIFFIGNKNKVFEKIRGYIIDNINVVKPDSTLTSPMVDYYGDHFVLKPASNRT